MSTNLSLVPYSSSVLYVRLVNKKDQLEWYTFSDFNRSRGLKGYGDYLPEPTPLKGEKISQFSRCVAVGSTIYCIGGRRLSSPGRLVVDNSVFFLDTSRPEREQLWVQAPSMLCPRSEHHAIVVNGKIFVMGGNLMEPWAEVFDPESRSWNPLPYPLQKPPSHFNLFCAAALRDSDLVLVGFKEGDCVTSPFKPLLDIVSDIDLFPAVHHDSDPDFVRVGSEVEDCVSAPVTPLSQPRLLSPSDIHLSTAAPHDSDLVSVGSQEEGCFLCTYNVQALKWEIYQGTIDNGPFRVQPVLVGSTLFWFNKSKLHAYDIIRKWHCSGPIKGLVEKIVPVDWLQDHSNIKPVLLHLAGDEFCWIHYEETTYYLTLLHCVQFRLSTLTESHLTAVAESCQSYVINTPSRLLDAVLI